MWSTSLSAEIEDKEEEDDLKAEGEDPGETMIDLEEKTTDLGEMMTDPEERTIDLEELKIDPEEMMTDVEIETSTIDRIKKDSTTEERRSPEEGMTETTTAEEIERKEETGERKEDTEKIEPIEDPEKISPASMPRREKTTPEERGNPSAGLSWLTSALLMMASPLTSRYIFRYKGSDRDQNRRRTCFQVQMCYCRLHRLC
jgi:hypothetical protein